MDCEFGSVPSKFCLGSTLLTTIKLSSKVRDNFTLPPLLTVPLYSTSRNRPVCENMPPHKYKDADLVNSASFAIEGDDSNEDPLVEAFHGDSITKLVSALFGDS